MGLTRLYVLFVVEVQRRAVYLVGITAHPTGRQLHRVLTEYLRHYNTVRPHRGLDLQPPRRGARLTLVEPGTGESSVQRVDVLGGLIHEYRRAA